MQDMETEKMTNRRRTTMTPADFRAARLKLGLTQDQLAQRMGVGKRTIYHWEYGSRHIPMIAVYFLGHILVDEGHHAFVKRLSEKISVEA